MSEFDLPFYLQWKLL